MASVFEHGGGGVWAPSEFGTKGGVSRGSVFANFEGCCAAEAVCKGIGSSCKRLMCSKWSRLEPLVIFDVFFVSGRLALEVKDYCNGTERLELWMSGLIWEANTLFVVRTEWLAGSEWDAGTTLDPRNNSLIRTSLPTGSSMTTSILETQVE